MLVYSECEFRTSFNFLQSFPILPGDVFGTSITFWFLFLHWPFFSLALFIKSLRPPLLMLEMVRTRGGSETTEPTFNVPTFVVKREILDEDTRLKERPKKRRKVNLVKKDFD